MCLFVLGESRLGASKVGLTVLPLGVVDYLNSVVSCIHLFTINLTSIGMTRGFGTVTFSLGVPLTTGVPVMILVLLVNRKLGFTVNTLSVLIRTMQLGALRFSGRGNVS